MIKFLRHISLLLLFVICHFNSYTQITTDPAVDIQTLIQDHLVGDGVTISNITTNGIPTQRYGTFDGTGSNIGIANGVTLATKNITLSHCGSTANGGSGTTAGNDPDLFDIVTANQNDISIIEFDFTTNGNEIEFTFVFASREYDIYVGSTFNDVFGFFLSGPGIAGPFTNNAINIAVLPNGDPVSINTVNAGQNNGYFVDNGDNTGTNGPPFMCFGGYTTPITINQAITCGETYHLKIVIANIIDGIRDSQVFFEQGSLTAAVLDATITAPATACHDDAPIQFTAATPGGTWSGTGIDAAGLFDPVTAGIGQHSITYSTGVAPCLETDEHIIDVQNCACNITNLTVNTSLPDCQQTWNVSGSTTFNNAPGSGNLIFQDCQGNTTVIASAPFSSPVNFTHAGLLGDLTGGNCDFTVYFSDDLACELTTTLNLPPYTPQDEAGTVTSTLTGNGTTNYILCDGDVLDIVTNNNSVIHPIAPGNDPSIVYYLYNCPPSPGGPGIVPSNDPCYVGIINSEDASLTNNGGDADAFLTGLGLGAGDQLYIVPITHGSLSGNTYSQNCYDLAIDETVITTYLNPITTSIVEDCQNSSADITISGGHSEFYGSNYTLSNLLPATASLSTTTSTHGQTVTISNLSDGDNYSFDIVDGNGCPHSISGTFQGLDEADFTYPANNFCSNEADPVATITGTAGGTFSVAPAGLTVDPISGAIDVSSATGTFTITYTTPDPVCFTTEDWNVTINSQPVINPINDVSVCDDYSLPAISGTNIPITAAYYTGPNGTGQSFAPTATINYADFGTYPLTLYAYAETGTILNCFDEESFELTIFSTPLIDPINDTEVCDEFTLPVITGLNLTGGQSYYTQANGLGQSITENTILTNAGTTTYYIYDEIATSPNCFNETSFSVTINLTPDITPINDEELCDVFTFPSITGVNLTGNEAFYTEPTGAGTSYSENDTYTTEGTTTFYIFHQTGTTPNCLDEESFDVTIHLTPDITPLANLEGCDEVAFPLIAGSDITPFIAVYDQPGGNGNTYPFNHIVTTEGTSTFYIYDESSDDPLCFDEESFDVTVSLTPNIDPITDQLLCEEYTLPEITGTNLTGTEAYYTQTNGGGSTIPVGTSYTNIQNETIYIYDETAGTPNCLDEEQFTLTVGTTPIFTVSSIDPTGCGTNDGQLIIEGLEPSTDYDVTYETNSNNIGPTTMQADANGTITLTNLAPGSYTNVRVDNEHCFSIDNTPFNLVEPDSPIIEAGEPQTVCEGTTITLTANNPDGAIISWNNDIEDGVAFIQEPGVVNYTVSADLNNCLSSDQVAITVLGQPVIDLPKDTSACESYVLQNITGTNLTANVSYFDAPNPNGTVLNIGDTVSTVGENTIYIFDEAGENLNCFDEQSFTITINTTPLLFTPEDQTVCDSYELTFIEGENLTVNANYFSEANGTGTLLPVGSIIATQGTTQVYIFDQTQTTPNCTAETSFNITVRPSPILTPKSDETVCDTYTFPLIEGELLTGEEAYYTGENGTGDRYITGDNFTQAGTTLFYIFDKTTDPVCTDETTFNVTINLTPQIDHFDPIDECAETILPMISGQNFDPNSVLFYTNQELTGLTYEQGENYVITGNTSLYAYAESGTTPNCTDTTTIDLLIRVQPSFSVTLDDPTECDVANGTITISGLDPNTTYTLVYQENGSSSGLNQYTTSTNGEIILENLGAGTYANFVIDLNDCPAISNASYTLRDPDLPSITASPDQVICGGDSTFVYVENPTNATITWSNNIEDSVYFTPSVGEITYTVTGEINNCTSTDSVTVFVAPAPIVFAGNDIYSCEGSQIILSASGADTYEWNNAVTDGIPFVPLETASYAVTGTTIYGCTGTDTVDAIIEDAPEVDFEADSLFGCIPHTVNFTNNSIPEGFDCTWQLGDGTIINTCDDITHTYTLVGCFDIRLVVRTQGGCSSTTVFEDYICVGGRPTANFTFNPNDPTTVYSTVEFENQSVGATDYEWSFGDGNTSIEEDPTHTYQEVSNDYIVQLTATNNNGCSDVATQPLRVDESLVFYVPNTFTPSNNGINDVFKPIFTSGFDPLNYRLMIFNRWGEVVFESFNSEIGWDGTYGINETEKAKEGTYTWKIEYLVKGEEDNRVVTGHVNLLK